MKSFATLCITAVACMLLLGCDSVRTENPIGRPASEDDVAQLSGRYKADQEIMQIHGIGGHAMRAAVLKWENEAYTIQELDVRVGVIDKPDTVFYLMNLRDHQSEADETGPYDFILARKRDNTLIVWPANIPAFAQAVHDEKLSGSVEKQNVLNVRLRDSSEKLTAFLEAEDLADYFHWEEPFFLERVGD